MSTLPSKYIWRMVCTKGRLALTLTLALVALFATVGVLAKDYSTFPAGNAAHEPTTFMASLSSLSSKVTTQFFNASSPMPTATPTPLPGICSNAPTTACGLDSDCPAGGTCKIPTSGGTVMPDQPCLAQASGISGGCTANDVSVAQTTSLRVLDKDPVADGVQGCLQPGDTATVSFVAQFHSTATTRYDVGVWTSQDGGSALTGNSCSVANFPSAPTPPWLNQESSIPADVCGDISSAADVYSSINNIEVACVDTNGDGNLDINTCLSWSQNATKKSADACTSPIQATAGTTSKCNCGKLPGIAILVPGKIKVDKVTKDPNGNTVNDPTVFNFTISGPDGDLPDNFQLAHADAVHESPALNAAAGAGTQYAVTEQPNSAYSTTATCVSDQFLADGVTLRPAQNPFAGNGMVTLHAGETLTCTYTNRLIDRCAGVTCQADTECATYACDPGDGVCKPSYEPATTGCTGTSNNGVCDATDHCDGAGSCVDEYKGAETTCREAVNACDVAEVCSGNSGACTAPDVFASADTTCTGTSNGGVCDAQDTCSGTDANCVDQYKGAETTCREAVNGCDVAEACSGNSGACTAPDVFASADTTCTGTSNGGVCDAQDTCSGTDATCVDHYKGAETTCRPALNECDVSEVCSGDSGACTATDAFASADTPCSFGQSNGGACDATDHCSGTGATCVDEFDTPPQVTLALDLLCENPGGPEQGGAQATQLVATASPVGPAYSYYWTGPDGSPILNGEGEPLDAAAITPTKPGTYTVVVTNKDTSCPTNAAFKLCFDGSQVADQGAAAVSTQPQATASFNVPARSEPTGFRAYLAKLLSVFG